MYKPKSQYPAPPRITTQDPQDYYAQMQMLARQQSMLAPVQGAAPAEQTGQPPMPQLYGDQRNVAPRFPVAPRAQKGFLI